MTTNKVRVFGVYLSYVLFLTLGIRVLLVNGFDSFSMFVVGLFLIVILLMFLEKKVGYQLGQILLFLLACLIPPALMDPFSDQELRHAGEDLIPMHYRIIIFFASEAMIFYILYCLRCRQAQLKGAKESASIESNK